MKQSNSDKYFIYILLIVIIFCSSNLLVKEIKRPKYDEREYALVQEEFSRILENAEDTDSDEISTSSTLSSNDSNESDSIDTNTISDDATPDIDFTNINVINKKNNKDVNLPEEQSNQSASSSSSSSSSSSRSSSSQVTTKKVVAVLKISKIGLNYPIIEETTMENLKISPTKFYGPDPNQVGNFCITGHNYRNGTHFGKLKQLSNNDVVTLTDKSGREVRYVVYSMYEIQPEDLACLSQDTNGKRELTLITCTNDSKRRLVVKCVEQ